MEYVTTPHHIPDPEIDHKMLDDRIKAETRPVNVRLMTEQEHAKYPPIRPTKADLLRCLEDRMTVAEIAAKYGVQEARVMRLAGIWNLSHMLTSDKPPKTDWKVAELTARFPKDVVVAAIRKHRSSKKAARALHISDGAWSALIKAHHLETGPGRSILEAIGEQRPPRRRKAGRVADQAPPEAAMQLARDMASFANVSVEEAFKKLQSDLAGLAGEAEKPEQDHAVDVAGQIAHLMKRMNEAAAANSPGDLTAGELAVLNELTTFVRTIVADPLQRITDDLHSHGHDFFAIGPARFKEVGA